MNPASLLLGLIAASMFGFIVCSVFTRLLMEESLYRLTTAALFLIAAAICFK